MEGKKGKSLCISFLERGKVKVETNDESRIEVSHYLDSKNSLLSKAWVGEKNQFTTAECIFRTIKASQVMEKKTHGSDCSHEK